MCWAGPQGPEDNRTDAGDQRRFASGTPSKIPRSERAKRLFQQKSYSAAPKLRDPSLKETPEKSGSGAFSDGHKLWDFLALAAEPGGQSGQFAPQRRRVARQQPQRNT